MFTHSRRKFPPRLFVLEQQPREISTSDPFLVHDEADLDHRSAPRSSISESRKSIAAGATLRSTITCSFIPQRGWWDVKTLPVVRFLSARSSRGSYTEVFFWIHQRIFCPVRKVPDGGGVSLALATGHCGNRKCYRAAESPQK